MGSEYHPGDRLRSRGAAGANNGGKALDDLKKLDFIDLGQMKSTDPTELARDAIISIDRKSRRRMIQPCKVMYCEYYQAGTLARGPRIISFAVPSTSVEYHAFTQSMSSSPYHGGVVTGTARNMMESRHGKGFSRVHKIET